MIDNCSRLVQALTHGGLWEMIDNCSVLARGLYADWPARAGLPRDALRLGLHVRDHSGWRLDKVDHGAAQPLPYGRAAGRALTHARRSCRPRWHRDERGVDDGRPGSTSRGLPLRLEGLPLRIRLFSKRLKFRQNLRCARQFSEIGSQQRARGGGCPFSARLRSRWCARLFCTRGLRSRWCARLFCTRIGEVPRRLAHGIHVVRLVGRWVDILSPNVNVDAVNNLGTFGARRRRQHDQDPWAGLLHLLLHTLLAELDAPVLTVGRRLDTCARSSRPPEDRNDAHQDEDGAN